MMTKSSQWLFFFPCSSEFCTLRKIAEENHQQHQQQQHLLIVVVSLHWSVVVGI